VFTPPPGSFLSHHPYSPVSPISLLNIYIRPVPPSFLFLPPSYPLSLPFSSPSLTPIFSPSFFFYLFGSISLSPIVSLYTLFLLSHYLSPPWKGNKSHPMSDPCFPATQPTPLRDDFSSLSLPPHPKSRYPKLSVRIPDLFRIIFTRYKFY